MVVDATGIPVTCGPIRPQASGDIPVAPQPCSRTLRPRCRRGATSRQSADCIGGGWLPPVTMLVWTVLVDVPAFGNIKVLRQGRIPRPTRCRYKAWTLVRPPPLGSGPGPRNGPRLSPSGKGWRRGFGPVRHPSQSPCFVYIRRGVDNLPAASVWASTLPRPRSTGLKGRAGRRRKLVPCWPPVAVVGTP